MKKAGSGNPVLRKKKILGIEDEEADVMKTKTQTVLHKMMPGTVHAQFVKCGKSNCKCSRGELHGAYYYHFVRVGGQLKKRYLKASEIEETQNACFRRQSQEKAEREQSRTVWNQLRELRSSLNELGSFHSYKED